MKKIVLFFCLCWMTTDGFSQVGINTTSPDAQLHVKSSNQATPTNKDGILIPKIDAFPITNPTAAQQGMMVYLTTLSAGKAPGFYYWDNTGTPQWRGIGGTKGWDITGNSGTNATINFLGTIDSVDVVFRRNNTVSGKIGGTSTSFGFESLSDLSTGNDNTAVGSQSMSLNTSGIENVAVGKESLFVNNSGSLNTAVGFRALGNADAANNTAIGGNAMVNNYSGGENVAVGVESLFNNFDGINNTAVGRDALHQNSDGQNNTGVGYAAGNLITSGSDNTAIGANADVPNPSGSNQLSIANVIYGTGTNASFTGRIGINEPAPNAKLQISASSETNPNNSDGIIIPRVSAFPIVNPGSAQNGMMVFLTAPLNKSGFYYWDNPTTTWKGFGANTGWSLTGNSGTNPATNFIGTTDNNNIVFKRNNAKAGLLGSYIAGYGAFSLNANTTGTANAAFGAYSLAANTTGDSNVAIGTDAMSRIQQGSRGTTIGSAAMFYFSGPSGPFTNTNVAIGAPAMRGESFGSLPGSNNIGLNNTAVGYQVLNGISSGSDNTVQGYNAMSSNTTGNKNVAFGSEALFSNTSGNSNVVIGYQAGYNETGSNKLYIENSNSATPLIYGEFDNDLIRINGKTESIYTQLTANGDGQSSIFGYRTRDSQNDGTGYGRTATNRAVGGYNLWGDLYTFGVTGHSDNDFTRTGGVLGSITGGTYWSSLGYKNSGGTAYGVYATAALATGTGRFSQPQKNSSIGGGFYGGMIGSWSKGNVIGQISSGNLFASYNSGDEYTTGKQIELVDTGNQKTAAYTVTSTESIVYKKGKTTLVNGTVRVDFDKNYLALLGEIPVVTITPMGQCSGLYIESIDQKGFVIKELNNGTSNVAISWIAVGDRIDAKQNILPKEILDKDFDKNINEVMFNENNKTETAKAVWFDGKDIQFGQLPSEFIEKTTNKEE